MIDLTTVAAPNLHPAPIAFELPGTIRLNAMHRADDLPCGRMASQGGRDHSQLLKS